MYLCKREQEAAKEAAKAEQEALKEETQRIAAEKQQADLDNDPEQKTKQDYYKARKYLTIKDSLRMCCAIRCILGPM